MSRSDSDCARMPPFRFGVQLSRAASGHTWRELARRIEGLGYSTLFVPDHFEDQFGPLVALTVAAEATTTLRVGSLVFGNDYRLPMVLAKEIATLDLPLGGQSRVRSRSGMDDRRLRAGWSSRRITTVPDRPDGREPGGDEGAVVDRLVHLRRQVLPHRGRDR